MIIYDSHKWCTFWSIRGSIFPKAVAYALPSATLAFCLKYWNLLGDTDGVVSQNGTIYSGFTFVLGFILVFRTTQSYNRYWLGATAVHTMRAEWFDACGSLCAFVQMTPKGEATITEFTHTMIRLFGLMHAMALEEIASMENEDFPLLDIAGLRAKDLRVLTSEAAQGRKVEIVAQWIKTYIIKAHETGDLPVPAPILTRVFQELGTGLVHYHEALQVVIWPFPFPYAQMCSVLIAVYMVVTPLVITLWTTQAWYAAIATLTSVVCMKGIDVIAAELENPFGDDANDLPTWQMHHAMNRDLVLLANPSCWTIPKLEATAITDYKALVQANKNNQLSLEAYQKQEEESRPVLKSLRTMMPSHHDHNTPKGSMFKRSHSPHAGKLDAAQEFKKQSFAARRSRTGRMLNLPSGSMSLDAPGLLAGVDEGGEDDFGTDLPGEVPEPLFVEVPVAPESPPHKDLVGTPVSPNGSPPLHRWQSGGSLSPKARWQSGGSPSPWCASSVAGDELRHAALAQHEADPWSGFLHDLADQWRLHLMEQLAQQERVNQSHFSALQDLLRLPPVELAPHPGATSSHNKVASQRTPSAEERTLTGGDLGEPRPVLPPSLAADVGAQEPPLQPEWYSEVGERRPVVDVT